MPDLILATPDSVPRQLLDLWDRHLTTTFRADRRQADSASAASGIRNLHQLILRDHQKTWFQLCRKGYRLFDNEKYAEAAGEIVSSLPSSSAGAIVDPLLCFFSPLWADRNNESVRILFYSEPLECAVSLRDTWRFRVQFGLALWEYYVINALEHLAGGKHILFSLSRFRDAPSRYLNDTLRRYHALKDVPDGAGTDRMTLDDSGWMSVPATPDRGQYATEAAERLYNALETDRLDDLGGARLSDSSSDILFHYGNLRAGYDEIKQARDEMALELHNLKEAGAEHADHADDTAPSAATDSDVEVVVHIDGMSPFTFVSEPDSPVIAMLRTTLQSQSRNPGELVYLESQGEEMGALYFAAGDLLAVETNTPALDAVN